VLSVAGLGVGAPLVTAVVNPRSLALKAVMTREGEYLTDAESDFIESEGDLWTDYEVYWTEDEEDWLVVYEGYWAEDAGA
jgi:hypothetical protein